jgi:hypothetical protein
MASRASSNPSFSSFFCMVHVQGFTQKWLINLLCCPYFFSQNHWDSLLCCCFLILICCHSTCQVVRKMMNNSHSEMFRGVCYKYTPPTIQEPFTAIVLWLVGPSDLRCQGIRKELVRLAHASPEA